ncbi:MAG: phospholipid carrier-dependent glycosyltransferase [Candidatus Eisenbacteria bacterium]|uniref:Phospholipid carrier-dependent glycosyltransferase n=1 Tax=Eiseniibacteriota bacterium TaxID=2212470 RepID=A0A956NJD9_UNCEI|nr:phospholipid carrier-dependent glycosyltransferase [Candidatus Eisenbacteria bacterium]
MTSSRFTGNALRQYLVPASLALLVLLVLVPNVFVLPAESLYPIRSDSEKYDNAAMGFAHFVEDLPTALPKLFGGEFSDEERERYEWGSGILQHAPSYVVPLGLTYSLLGHSEKAGRLFTVLLSAATAFLLVWWTERRFGRIAAALAGVAFAFWPPHVYFGTAIMTEMPITFGVIAAIVGLESTRALRPADKEDARRSLTDKGSFLRRALSFRRRDIGPVAFGGALLALAALAKFSLLYLILPFLLLDVVERGRRAGWLAFVGLRLAGLGLVFGLWGGFLAGADLPREGVSGGFTSDLFLFRGNYAEDRGFETVGLGDANVPVLVEAVRRNSRASAGEMEEDEYVSTVFRDALRATIRQDPIGWLALVGAKANWFWSCPAVSTDVQAWFGRIPPPTRFQLVVVIFGLLGIGAVILGARQGFLPLLFVTYLMSIHAVTHLVGRYDIPAVALMFGYSAGGAALLGRWVRDLARRRAGEVEPSSALPSAFGPRSFRTPRVAILAVGLVLLLLFVLVPRDVWVGGGMAPATAALVHAFTGFASCLALGVWLLSGWWGRRAWPRVVGAALLPVVFGLLGVADVRANRDPDQWEARLSKPGDTIVQRLEIPADLEWKAVIRAEVAIDMLADAGTKPVVVVRLDGTVLRQFPEGIANLDEDYLMDRRIHGAQKRYERVLRAYDEQLDSYVRHRYPDAGHDFFLQWYRIPVEVDSLRGRTEVEIEIELIDPKGGGVTVFGDGDVEPSPRKGPTRRVHAPAYLENPYELSVYQFRLFGSDRKRADVRLTRPMDLYSSHADGAFVRGGEPLKDDLSPARGAQRGEYRVRLRTKLRGYYVYRDRGKPDLDPIWAVYPKPDELPVSANDLRHLSARREDYFNGWWSY